MPVFRNWLLAVLGGDVIFSFCWDRLMQFLFCPTILFASLEGTTIRDVIGLFKTIGMIGGLMYMFLGDEDTWEEMLREDGYYDNITNATEAVADKVAEMAGAIRGEVAEL
jgi:cation-transporting ATPase 13A1